jgi:hypothetical protein
MGFETKWAGDAIRPTRDRRAPKSHRHGSWIERLFSSAFRTVVEGFARYGAAYTGAPYPESLLPAHDQPRFPGFDEVRPDGGRAAWEGIDNQTLKDIGIPDETEHTGEPQNRRSGQCDRTRTLFPLCPAGGEAESRQDRGQQAGAVHIPRVGH